MSNALIVLDLPKLSATITAEAQAIKAAALERCALVARVEDAATNQTAVEAQAELKQALKLAEDARKAAKAPLNQLGKAVESSVAAFIADLKDEDVRITTLIGDFQTLQLAKQQAAERAARLEAERLERERREAELATIRAAEAERQKLAAQQAEVARLAKAADAKAAEALRIQQIELEQAQRAAEAKSHDELDRIHEEHDRAMAELEARPKPEQIRARGQRIDEDWEIIITDVWALVRAHPACVRIEPLKGEIKALLKAGVKVAGVTATKVVKPTVSTGNRRAVVEV